MLYPYNRTRPGFTIIEVMIATTIIGVIAASAAVSLLKTKLTARNGQRKEVATTYSKAVGSYAATAGSTFVTTTGVKSSCTLPDTDTTSAQPGPGTSTSTNSACVGANGRSFGMLNLTNSSVADALSGLPTGTSYQYTSQSILDALKTLGFLSTISFDPLVKTVTASTRDYLLLSCCEDGRQSIGQGGTNFAIWAQLESTGTPPLADQSSKKMCGGSDITPPGWDTSGATSAANPYKYTFAATSTPAQNLDNPAILGYTNTDWFAVGNAPIQDATSMVSDTCKTS